MIPGKETPVQRRSGRIVRQPIRYEHEAYVLVSDTEKENPLTFKEAMDDPKKEKWQEAMNQEMESMYSNSVWELVDPPKDVRAIGCMMDPKQVCFKKNLTRKCTNRI